MGIRITTVGRGTDTQELRTQLSNALDAYKAAVAQAEAGGDYAAAKAVADRTGAEVVETCRIMGRPFLGYCIGQPTLPPFPPPSKKGSPPQGSPASDFDESRRVATLIDQYNTSLDDPNFDPEQAKLDLVAACEDIRLADLVTCAESVGRTLNQPSRSETTAAKAGAGTLTTNESAELLRRVAVLADDYNARVNDPSFDQLLAKAKLNDLCEASGLGDLAACVARTGRSLATSGSPTAVAAVPDEERARLVRITRTAPQGYLDAINGLSIGGDYADARDIAMTHLAELQDACTRLGTPSLTKCIPGVVLPPFPEPDLQAGGGAKGGSGTLTAEESAEAMRRVAVLVDDYNARMNDPSFDPLAAKARLNDLCEASGLGDLAKCISGLGLSLNDASQGQKLLEAVKAYTIATADLTAGDASGGPRMDAELAIIRTECQALGHTELSTCLEAVGATLPPTPRNKVGSATVVVVPLTDEERARLVRITQTAPQGYLDAINGLSIGGNYADTRDIAMTHLAELEDACARLGTPNLTECVPGVVLPPFPEPGTQVAGGVPAAGTTGNAVADSKAYIRSLVDEYNRHIADAKQYGDFEDARVKLPFVLQQLAQVCGVIGTPNPDQCLAEQGYLPLEPLPAPGANPGSTTTVAQGDPLAAAEATVRAAVNLYSQGTTKLGAGDASGQSDIDVAMATLQQICAPLGFASNEECVANYGLTLPTRPTSNPAITKLEASRARLEGGTAPLTDAQRDVEVAKAQSATTDYFAAIDAAKVDYDAAFNKATSARQALSEACAALGDPDVDHCIGMTLPAFPPRETAAAATGTGTGTGATIDPGAAAREELARARNGYEAGNAAMLALAKSGGAVGDTSEGQVMIATAINQITTTCNAIAGSEVINIASPMSALDDCLVANGLPPLSTPWHMVGSTFSPEVLDNLKMMVGDYNALAQSTAPFDKDGLQKAIGDYCAANGLGDLKSCLGTAGLLLADQSVTTATMEKLPDGTTPTNAAPLLDSAKGGTTVQTTLPAGGTPTLPATATTLTTLTTVSVPKTDAEAQVNLPKVALPARLETGTPVDASTVRFTPPKSLPGGAGQPAAGRGLETSINLSATITPDGGFVFNLGGQVVISNPEQERKRVFDPKKDRIGYEKLTDDRVRETVLRPDGKKLITIRSNTGEVAQREVVLPSGKSFTLAAGTGPRLPNNKGDGRWRDPGDDLPPLRLTIPAEDYVLDADEVEADDLQFFLVQPPVERLARVYAIEEVKQSARVRDSVRRLEVGDLTFDSGKSTLPSRQIGSLEDIADAMLELLERNPAETFLIEGHTDAVGDETSNLALSDDRALEVARVLSEEYDVPPENLATQGYGETFLKVKTESAEAANRRVTIRRITPLITVASAR